MCKNMNKYITIALKPERRKKKNPQKEKKKESSKVLFLIKCHYVEGCTESIL